MGQRLTPGVQDREAADLAPEPSGIGGQRGHGLDGALEQDRIDGSLVLEGDGGDRRGQREHDMEIGNRQQFGLSVRQPLRPRRALTLRAMPIAARVVGDARRAAIVAGFDVTAERRRSARHDRAHDAPLGPPDMSGVVAKIGLAMAAQDVCDFDRRPAKEAPAGHRRLHAVYPGGMTSSESRSSGLGVARIVCGGDLRIARRRRQIVMSEQNLNDPDVGSTFQEMGREAVAQGVQRDPLVRPAALTADRQAACRTVGSIGWSRRGRETGRSSAAPASNRRAGCRATAATASRCGLCRPCRANQDHACGRCRCRPLSVPRPPTPSAPPHRPWSAPPGSSGSKRIRETARLRRRSARPAACAARAHKGCAREPRPRRA